MSDPGPGRPVWYRSLYGRIALGFILCVACVLLAQGALFLWLASRSSAALIRSPHDLAALAGSALSSALEAGRLEALFERLAPALQQTILRLAEGPKPTIAAGFS